MIKKVTNQAAAPASDDLADEKTAPVDSMTTRDEFAMRIAAAIVGGIIQRGGVAAVASAYHGDQLMETAYHYADMAMRVRAKS